jgi:hypothetical protein
VRSIDEEIGSDIIPEDLVGYSSDEENTTLRLLPRSHGTITTEAKMLHKDEELNNLLPKDGLVRENVFLADQEHKHDIRRN